MDAAENKPAVDAAVSTAKEKMQLLKTNNTFPSVLEEFNLEEFTDEFFADYALILLPFQWPYLLYEYLDFYTVFVENGKINFLIELTNPLNAGNTVVDSRILAVIVPKLVFNQYEIGESRIFRTYSSSGNPIKNDREWLKEIEGKSIENRVSYVYYDSNSTSTSFPALDNPAQFKQGVSEITAILSIESLHEYFII